MLNIVHFNASFLTARLAVILLESDESITVSRRLHKFDTTVLELEQIFALLLFLLWKVPEHHSLAFAAKFDGGLRNVTKVRNGCLDSVIFFLALSTLIINRLL